MEKMPFLKPQLETNDKEKLSEALEAERLAVDLKVKREEMLSIFDEAGEYFDYESIVGSEDFSSLSSSLREKMEGRFRGAQEVKDRQSTPDKILFEDFKDLWQENPKIFITSLLKAIRTKENNNIALNFLPLKSNDFTFEVYVRLSENKKKWDDKVRQYKLPNEGNHYVNHWVSFSQFEGAEKQVYNSFVNVHLTNWYLNTLFLK